MKNLIPIFDYTLKETVLGHALQLIELFFINYIKQMTTLRVIQIGANDQAILFALFMRVHT